MRRGEAARLILAVWVAGVVVILGIIWHRHGPVAAARSGALLFVSAAAFQLANGLVLRGLVRRRVRAKLGRTPLRIVRADGTVDVAMADITGVRVRGGRSVNLHVAGTALEPGDRVDVDLGQLAFKAFGDEGPAFGGEIIGPGHPFYPVLMGMEEHGPLVGGQFEIGPNGVQRMTGSYADGTPVDFERPQGEDS